MIDSVNEADYPRLLEVWESAVKSTHDFLKIEDFEFYKSQMPTYFAHLKVYAYKDEQGSIRGFLGVADSKIEMLFVDDAFRGTGIGKILMNFAINELKIDKVDVNEQNEQALGFYHRLGFKVVKRSACDEEGKDYPILHLERSDSVKKK
ncbi:GNAT family N-acetyltransferase [uncultured Bacteroides sp.]|uniref:GNAT family N-acetyltransferase n=1 Tax=uncultured Bacteroides sp. TaxID=162156 RepID=UPI002AABCFE1|nr:GNAT family N-acetyltransferase [uncultured Bacteroides sp.]